MNSATRTLPLQLWLPALLILAALLAYFRFVITHAIDVPFADDIYDVLQVLVGFEEAETLSQRVSLLFAQHNDHRTMATRALYLGIYKLTGEVDFRLLVVAANLALPAFLGLFFLAVRERQDRLVLVAVAALLLLNLRCYGITLWSMAAFAYFYVFLYGFLAIFALHRGSLGGLLLAAVFATLSTFTLASGQLTWVLGAACLLHQACVTRRIPGWRLVLWLGLGALALALWRYQLQTPNTPLAVLEHLAEFPGHYVLYTLTLLGSFVSETSVAFAATAGAALLCMLTLASLRCYRSGDLRLALCGWLVALSACAVVLGRAHFTTVDYALSSRYGFPSVLMAATTWLAFATQLRRAVLPLSLAATALAGWFCISSYQSHLAALEPHMAKQVQRFNRGVFWAYGKPLKESQAIVKRAVELGIYSPPERPLRLPGDAPAGRPTGGDKHRE